MSMRPVQRTVSFRRAGSGSLRVRERQAPEQFLADARDEPVSAPFFVLAGEPGMGKTRLLESAGQVAVRQGWRVLVGGCIRTVGCIAERRGRLPQVPSGQPAETCVVRDVQPGADRDNRSHHGNGA